MSNLELADEVRRIYNEGFSYEEALSILKDFYKNKEGNTSDL